MAQLKLSCNVSNGSQLVTVPGQDVSADIKASQIFLATPYKVPYFVATNAVFNGTDTTFMLSGAYQDVSAALTPAVVVRDETNTNKIPLINNGDVGTAAIFTAAMYQIESLLNGGLSGGGGAGITSTDGLMEGLSNLYFTATRVRATPLTGVTQAASPNNFLTASQLVTPSDTVLDALGKINALVAGHIGQGDTQHALATPATHGFMSASDKAKLDGIPPGGGSGGVALTVGPTAPANPVHGQEWLDTTTGIRYTYTVDADSAEWVNYG
jgi:hypothetical protein